MANNDTDSIYGNSNGNKHFTAGTPKVSARVAAEVSGRYGQPHIACLPPHSFQAYEALAEELGEEFPVLAPKLAKEWEELRAIRDYRKTLELIGGTDD